MVVSEAHEETVRLKRWRGRGNAVTEREVLWNAKDRLKLKTQEPQRHAAKDTGKESMAGESIKYTQK